MCKILIVDDVPINHIITQKMIEKLGWSWGSVSGGNHALSELVLNDYDLILMDCEMPELDGYETSKMIRLSGAPYANIPIVALTADTTNGIREKCLLSGMNEYLTKPVPIGNLKEVIIKLLLSKSDMKQMIPTFKHLSNERLSTLQGLQTEDDPNFVARLFSDYQISIIDKTEKIKIAIEVKDLTGLIYEAHLLKSSSRNLGIEQIGNICEILEEFQNIDDPVEVQKIFLMLSLEMREVTQEIDKLILIIT